MTPRPTRPARRPAPHPVARPVQPPSGARAGAPPERARRRPPAGRPVLVGAGLLTAVLVLGWVLFYSPLLTARTVQLVGAQRLSQADLHEVVAPQLGQPLARVDTAALEDQLASLPAVQDVTVLRVWPSTVEVRVTETEPVAVVPTGEGFALVDAQGVTVEELAKAPPGLPVVSAATREAGDEALLAAAEVLHQLPQPLRAQVTGTQALTQDSVTLTLRSKATVVWGSPEQSARKAEVLAVLLQRRATVYDVSAPSTPVTR